MGSIDESNIEQYKSELEKHNEWVIHHTEEVNRCKNAIINYEMRKKGIAIGSILESFQGRLYIVHDVKLNAFYDIEIRIYRINHEGRSQDISINDIGNGMYTIYKK